MNQRNFEIVVVGAGIVGLTIARELTRRGHRDIAILEKEPKLGVHASGRNSGVLHAGIYYTPGSLKAKVCVRGKQLMEEFAQERGIPWRRDGKVIVAKSPDELPALADLFERAVANGVPVHKVSREDLKEIEPEATTCEWALHSPGTAVIDSKAVLAEIARELESVGVTLLKATPAVRVNPEARTIECGNHRVSYGHLVNCAGLQADWIAHQMDVGLDYRILPFRGGYRKLRPEAASRFRGSIYPVPDMRVPFLGVHVTPTIDRQVTLGPTSMPAFGRENYEIFKGLSMTEFRHMAGDLAHMIRKNHDGMRTLVREEIAKYWPGKFLAGVQALAPCVRAGDIVASDKVGLRAQLVNRRSRKLVFDFLVERGPDSTHVLNAVSPAFTASMAFAELVSDMVLSGNEELSAV